MACYNMISFWLKKLQLVYVLKKKKSPGRISPNINHGDFQVVVYCVIFYFLRPSRIIYLSNKKNT